MGTVHAGTIYGTRFRVGGGSDQDIYFEDSGIRLYDASARNLRFYKAGYATFTINIGSGTGLISSGAFAIESAGSPMYITVGANTFRFYSSGTFKFPSVWSQPSGSQGMMAYNDSTDRFAGFIGGSSNKCGHWLLTSGW